MAMAVEQVNMKFNVVPSQKWCRKLSNFLYPTVCSCMVAGGVLVVFSIPAGCA